MGTYHDTNNDECVQLLSEPKSVKELVENQIQQCTIKGDDRQFLICDLGDVISKYRRWAKLLPRVKIFYAVKCFDELPVLKILWDCGSSFDCASRIEMKKVLSLGVSPDRIIFAHPCKQASMLNYAKKNDVTLMTFDNESELQKIADIYTEARLVLRIRIVSPYKGKLDFGTKYGCLPSDVEPLLQKAKELRLSVVGISFHVGSNCSDKRAFSEAIKQAKRAFDIARDMGLNLKLLDIGGGFPGHKGSDKTFEDICRVINDNLDKYFPEEECVEVIAEPGRYMVASAGTIGVNVVSRRKAPVNDDTGDFQMMYYINDGVYGSFLCKLVEEESYTPILVKENNNGPLYESSIWGPSCDSIDLLIESIKLPLLDVGDFMYFQDMGAYSLPLATRFNGMETPRKVFYCQKDLWTSLYGTDRDDHWGMTVEI